MLIYADIQSLLSQECEIVTSKRPCALEMCILQPQSLINKRLIDKQSTFL